jgi:hypothetical protein
MTFKAVVTGKLGATLRRAKARAAERRALVDARDGGDTSVPTTPATGPI